MNYICYSWFERDRQNIRLETEEGVEIFDLWDDDVDEAIVDGFLDCPSRGADWLPCAIKYAEEMGLI